MCFSAFFDASGKHDDRVLTVGGYVASKDEWLAFDNNWSQALHAFGLNSYFHMSEFINHSGQFKGWARSRRAHLFDRLTMLIQSHVRKAFGCAILCEEFRAVNRDYYLAERLGHPFPMAAMSAMGRVFMWAAENGHKEPILSVFEDGDTHKGELIDLAKQYIPDTRLCPVFQTKALTPLQAADIAAWDLHNVVNKVLEVADVDIWGKSYKRLHDIPNDYPLRGRKELLGLCADLKIPRRES